MNTTKAKKKNTINKTYQNKKINQEKLNWSKHKKHCFFVGFFFSTNKTIRKWGVIMSRITDVDIFLEKLLIDEYMIKKNTARFFTYLLDLFSVTKELVSSTKLIGEDYNCHERTIRNYIKELNDKNLIHKRPHRSQKDPDRPYIEYTTFLKTRKTDAIINKVNIFKKQQRDIFFIPETDKQAKKNHRRY